MPDDTLLGQLRSSVAILAAPAIDQIAHLRKINAWPCADELALDFHDVSLTAPRLSSEGIISSEALTLIAQLDEKLNSFSGTHNATEWNDVALSNSRNWAEVRTMAAALLRALN